MAGLIDLDIPPIIGMSDREMGIVCDALRRRKVDLVGMRRLCDRVDAPSERDGYARQILELDLVRAKLGDTNDEETGS